MAQTRTEDFRLDDGRALRLSYAEPDGVTRGGLVVLHEARGITDAVTGIVTGLAAEGWLVVVPHLYPGAEGSAEVGHAEAADKVSELSGDSALAATDIAFAWLARHGLTADRIGVIGFELGGAVALVVAAGRDIGAAVTVSGGGILEPLSHGLPALVEVAGELRVPWLGLYRDDSGDGISPEQVEKLREAASTAKIATDVVRYHFDTGASEAWQRALNWFDAHLR
ncbi:dienelactone hydrolase family protein [Actinokineospora sp. NBRC 105648]|uniref:dienelactone hydrolase family protein n=1 Tax=Actinokineospora sp. NBRC 105648 TaxID=3032206 RepID=UPI00255229A1|nr:dienelactone hydrolase family protein [Actinokineospora sp. NBRC 105648]